MSRPDGYYWLIPPAHFEDHSLEVVQIVDDMIYCCGDECPHYMNGEPHYLQPEEDPPHYNPHPLDGTLVGPLEPPPKT